MAAGVKITGLKEVVRDLNRLGVESQDLKDTFSGLSRLGQARARKFAPKKSGKVGVVAIRASRRKNAAVDHVAAAATPQTLCAVCPLRAALLPGCSVPVDGG